MLRQQYALEMLRLLQAGKRVINVDESWLSETEYSRRMWCPSTAPATITERGVNPRLALLAALDTDGRAWFALTHATTDSDVMALFLGHLCRQLEMECPGYLESSVVLLDNAT